MIDGLRLTIDDLKQTERFQPLQSSIVNRQSSIFAASWPAILLASLILLPFLGKAHTIDDPTFLLQSEHILKDPLHPTAFDMVFDGEAIRLSSQMVSGPVMAFLLIPSVLLGGAEWAAHLVQYGLTILAIFATVSLAIRLGLDGPGARIAGLILAATPAVLAMATTSMSDVPAMAFAVVGMERFVAWTQIRSLHRGLAAAAAFSLAALSRPHLILILLIAVFFLLSKLLFQPTAARPESGAEIRAIAGQFVAGLWPLALASIAILVIAHITADPGHVRADFLSSTVSRFNRANVASNLAAFFLHWITLFPLGLIWLSAGVQLKRLWLRPALYAAPVVLFGIFVLDHNVHGLSATVLILSGAGLFVLLAILSDAWKERDATQLFLWAWLLIALPASAYVQLPAKYLIGSAPAASILIARLYSRVSSKRRQIAWAAVAAGVLLGILIISADARFAAIPKRVAAEQIAPLTAKGITVWSNGGWGYTWYALKAGANPLSDKHPFPSKGDVLVSSSAAPHISLDKFPNRKLIGSIGEVSRLGQIMNYSAGVGFYSNGYGFFPWSWRNGQIEYVSIWEIE